MSNKTGTSQQQNESKKVKTWLILPKDSVLFLQKITDVCKINPSLSHNRFLKMRWVQKKDKVKQYENSLLDSMLRKNPVKDQNFCNRELIGIMDLANKRNERLARGFPSQLSYLYKPDKLIVGTGGDTPYGNLQMIRLNSIYGAPYLPATAIKGSLRTCWILEEFGGDEQKAEKNQSFRRLFGTANEEDGGERGSLVFFDTFPNTFSLGLDVQTPHYTKGMTDDQNPVAIYFTCLFNPVFEINLACRDKKVWIEDEQKVKEMLDITFLQYGIGAKTALGYGIGKAE